MHRTEELVDLIEDLMDDLRSREKWNLIEGAIEVVSRIEGKPRKPDIALPNQCCFISRRGDE